MPLFSLFLLSASTPVSFTPGASATRAPAAITVAAIVVAPSIVTVPSIIKVAITEPVATLVVTVRAPISSRTRPTSFGCEDSHAASTGLRRRSDRFPPLLGHRHFRLWKRQLV